MSLMLILEALMQQRHLNLKEIEETLPQGSSQDLIHIADVTFKILRLEARKRDVTSTTFFRSFLDPFTENIESWLRAEGFTVKWAEPFLSKPNTVLQVQWSS